MASIGEFKRGDTFEFFISLKDSLDQPIILLATDIQGQIRDTTGNLIADCVIATTSTPGQYLITTADNSDWPLGSLLFDVKLIISGKKRSIPTSTLEIVKEVTQWKT